MPKPTVLTILMILACSCGRRDAETELPYSDETLPVTALSRGTEGAYALEPVSSIGSNTDSLYFFGNVSQIEVTDESVFVLDYVFQRLSVYDRQNGVFLHRHDFARGPGPGEIDGPLFFAIDDSGHYYVSSNRDYRIHKFDQDFQFHRSFQQVDIVRVYFIRDNLHLLRQPAYSTPKPLVSVIDQNGRLVNSYGEEHSKFKTLYDYRIQRLQGAGYPYLTNDSDHIYIAYALPFEIRVYAIGSQMLQSRYVFESEYAGGTFTDPLGILHYPTGLVVGVDNCLDYLLLVFSIHWTARRDYAHYVNVIDLEEATYCELLTSDYGIAQMEVYPRYATYQDLVYLYVIEPFPMIKVMRLVRNANYE